ncbi:MAG: chromosome partitioning protein [Deltaproteobacteria bacterium CG_4_10_14_0_2_um_filter_43_8]|nr:MAG: chromosome partitioning protein [Deltaproteobacteria bacterium CG11_big_fil_rev_8_21_14_0_20_42_23]PJA18202.1 MAG: chromosome partitioning protein [Deltaproteobacteria bacterium CG_4_10_14_0_2_um_filter_43_8]PJC63486.1 MAG: chromosome partitioning protein [Deltaproteobacteria bacterium CG_4_9_14_0_2_um_filter_42_21]
MISASGVSEPISIRGSVQKRNLIPSAKKVLAVASGKGGVGKSSLAVNLAVALGKQGKKVGLLDADIYGPSVTHMMGLAGVGLTVGENDKMNPVVQFGIKTISVGNLVPAEQAMIWRGPMVHQLLQQLMSDVNWGELDVLVLDLPPGTGDVHLTMIQTLQVDGVLLVTTPQSIAVNDVRKCVDMFRKVNIPLIGVVENLAYFECEHGSKYYPFGKEGGRRLAEEFNIPFFGELALMSEIMEGAEAGKPYALRDGVNPFATLSEKIIESLNL